MQRDLRSFLGDTLPSLKTPHQWFNGACPNSSAMNDPDYRINFTTPTFIASHSHMFDLCKHPESTQEHGYINYNRPWAGEYKAMFSLSKTALYSDPLGVPFEAYQKGNLSYTPWQLKSRDKLVWRGSTTGALWSEHVDVRKGHRQRLVKLMNATGQVDLLIPTSQKDASVVKDVNASALADRYLDLAFVGRPCRKLFQ
jgi:hypothetical protein